MRLPCLSQGTFLDLLSSEFSIFVEFPQQQALISSVVNSRAPRPWHVFKWHASLPLFSGQGYKSTKKYNDCSACPYVMIIKLFQDCFNIIIQDMYMILYLFVMREHLIVRLEKHYKNLFLFLFLKRNNIKTCLFKSLGQFFNTQN